MNEYYVYRYLFFVFLQINIIMRVIWARWKRCPICKACIRRVYTKKICQYHHTVLNVKIFSNALLTVGRPIFVQICCELEKKNTIFGLGKYLGLSKNLGVILFSDMTSGICLGWLQAQILQGHTSLSIGKKTVSNTVLLLLPVRKTKASISKHRYGMDGHFWVEISTISISSYFSG